MSLLLARCPNCLGVGYSASVARRVLSGAGSARLGEFVAGALRLVADRRAVSPRFRADRRAAGLHGLAARLRMGEALQLGVVAPLPSHGRQGSEAGQGFRPGRRLIASYRTASSSGRIERGSAGGVRPPSASIARPYTLSRPCDLGSAKIGLAAVRSTAGRIGRAFEPGANVSPAPMGSGVLGSRKKAGSAAEKGRSRAARAAGQNRVRVLSGGHEAFDLARVRTLGRGLG